MLNGMNVARLNFRMDIRTREADCRNSSGITKPIPVAIMLDTKGGNQDGVNQGWQSDAARRGTVDFTTEDVLGTKERVSISYKGYRRMCDPLI